MFATPRELDGIKFLERKEYVGSECVFKMKCQMVFKRLSDRYGHISTQTDCKGIEDWDVVIDGDEIFAWADLVGSVFGDGPKKSFDRVTVASCNLSSPQFVHIRLIPENHLCTIYDAVGSYSSKSYRKRVEIASRRSHIGEMTMGHFYSDDDGEFFAFVDKLMEACGIPEHSFKGFDWNGTSCLLFKET